MPGLIGGFLRRNREIMYLKRYSCVDLMCNILQQGLFRALFSNEGMVEGRMNKRNSQFNIVEKSKCSLNIVMFISRTKVNLCIKIGSAIVLHVELRRMNNKLEEYPRNQIFIIDPMFNTDTEGYLSNIQGDLYHPSHNFFKYGNLGKDLILKSSFIDLDVLWFFYKTILNLIKFTKTKLLLYNVGISNSNGIEMPSYHGGKITKKANVISNVLNIGLHRPVAITTGQKLNLVFLLQDNKEFVRYYSIQDDSLIKNNRLENIFEWPDSRELGNLYMEVTHEQMKLVDLAEKYGQNSNEVQLMQRKLIRSKSFRIIAIQNLAISTGSKTSGIDKVTLYNTKEFVKTKIDLVEYLRYVTYHPNKYVSDPVKRIYIPKSSGKMRPIGIPTIKDRALQHLIKLVLEPMVEMSSDVHSYGFRRYRSTKHALGFLRNILRTQRDNFILSSLQRRDEDKYILDADIEGFFDNINHDWLINNLPLHKDLLKFVVKWLKSGIIDKETFILSETGTPQGGVISPILANHTLNGLEKVIYDSILPLTRSKEKRINIKLNDGTTTRLGTSLNIVRFADDFIILARSRHILESYVFPSLINFLKERGLNLSKSKTKLFKLSDPNAELNFLGYTFKYNKNWSYKRTVMYSNHSGEAGIALYPNKDNLLKMISQLRGIFNKSLNLDSYNLITRINPLIRGWANYYNLGNSAHYRDVLRNTLYKLVWNWAHEKHRRWGKKKIAKYYFLNSVKNDENRIDQYSKFKNTKWVFYGKTWAKSRYNVTKDRIIYMVDPSNVNSIVAGTKYRLPNNISQIHAFHRDYMKLVHYNTKLSMLSASKHESFKDKLLKRQNGLCVICNQIITEDLLRNNAIHIHHIEPIYKGGSRNKLSNMEILHSWCHYEIDHK